MNLITTIRIENLINQDDIDFYKMKIEDGMSNCKKRYSITFKIERNTK